VSLRASLQHFGVRQVIKPSVFVLCLMPMAWLVYAAVSGALGPDPAQRIMHVSGEWTIRLLAITLLMSPLRHWTGSVWPVRLRRMLGLYTFFYGTVHLLSFAQFYVGWTPAILVEELAERPYIMAGFGAWLLMLPMAITSNRAMQRTLGRNWKRLQRLVYVAAVLACLHLIWLARSDIGLALFYSALFACLLLWRLRERFPLSALRRTIRS